MKLSADLNKIYITSDTHGFHKNITRGTSIWTQGDNIMQTRDFDTPDLMTEYMVDRFNSIIPKDSILFHLGDFSFAGEANVPRLRSMLNVETIHFIKGNHDQHLDKYQDLFTSVNQYLELSVGEFNFVLFHFPIESWNNIRRGWFHIHGHQHFQNDLRFGNGKKFDCGVDGNNLTPYKLTDLIDLLKDRQFVIHYDHHA